MASHSSRKLFQMLRSQTERSRYSAKAMQTESGDGNAEYLEYYRELFKDPTFMYKAEDYTFLDAQELG